MSGTLAPGKFKVAKAAAIKRYSAPQWLIEPVVSDLTDHEELDAINQSHIMVLDTNIKGWGPLNAVIRVPLDDTSADYLAEIEVPSSEASPSEVPQPQRDVVVAPTFQPTSHVFPTRPIMSWEEASRLATKIEMDAIEAGWHNSMQVRVFCARLQVQSGRPSLGFWVRIDSVLGHWEIHSREEWAEAEEFFADLEALDRSRAAQDQKL